MSVLLAGQVLGTVASRKSVSVAALRMLGIVAALNDSGRVVGNVVLAQMLGHERANHVPTWGEELKRLGWIERHRHDKSHIGWRVLPAGHEVLGLLAREERAARARVAGTFLRPWPRRYTKSAAWYAARGKVPPGGPASL